MSFTIEEVNSLILNIRKGDSASKELLVNENIPLDKVLVVGLNSEPYSQLFYNQFWKYLYKELYLFGYVTNHTSCN